MEFPKPTPWHAAPKTPPKDYRDPDAAEKIVLDYLQSHNFDGLKCATGDCGCEMSNFVHCGGMKKTCFAAYELIDGTFPDDSPFPEMFGPAMDSEKTVDSILRAALKAKGFEGISDFCGCGCELSNLGCCGQISSDCSGGYIGPDPYENVAFLIYATKEEAATATDKYYGTEIDK